MEQRRTGSGDRGVPAIVWLLLLVGLFSLGFSAILIRYTVSEPGVVIALWRLLFVVALTTPALLVRERDDVARLQLGDWARIAFAGVMLGLHYIAWIQSLHHTSVASASVLVTTSPIFIAILGWVVLRERLSGRVIAGIAVATLGAFLIAWSDSGTPFLFPDAMLGNSLALSAALIFSVYILIGRAVRQRVSFLVYFVPMNAVAAVTALIGCLAQGHAVGIELPILLICLLIAVGPGLLGHGSIIMAVRYLPAAIVGLLMLTEPVLAGILAWILFSEIPPALSFVGMVLILVSVGFVVVTRARPMAGSGTTEGH